MWYSPCVIYVVSSSVSATSRVFDIVVWIRRRPLSVALTTSPQLTCAVTAFTSADVSSFRHQVLLVLDAAILEPDLGLFLRQLEERWDLDAPKSWQVHVGSELSLESQQLSTRERCAHALAVAVITVVAKRTANCTCEHKTSNVDNCRIFVIYTLIPIVFITRHC